MTPREQGPRRLSRAVCPLLCAALLAACVSAPDSSAPCPGPDAPDSSAASSALPHGASAPVPEGVADGADGEDMSGLPFTEEEAVFPEADRAVALPGGTVALRMDALSFALSADGEIGYTIENTTGHDIGVVLAPRLERWTDGAWEWIVSSVGFCGTPDRIGETHSSSLSLEWFPGLTEGVYRLTYTVAYDGEDVLPEERPFSACFSLTENAG